MAQPTITPNPPRDGDQLYYAAILQRLDTIVMAVNALATAVAALVRDGTPAPAEAKPKGRKGA